MSCSCSRCAETIVVHADGTLACSCTCVDVTAPLPAHWPREAAERMHAAELEEDSVAPYDPDCPACLRGRPHLMSDHDQALARVHKASC